MYDNLNYDPLEDGVPIHMSRLPQGRSTTKRNILLIGGVIAIFFVILGYFLFLQPADVPVEAPATPLPVQTPTTDSTTSTTPGVPPKQPGKPVQPIHLDHTLETKITSSILDTDTYTNNLHFKIPSISSSEYTASNKLTFTLSKLLFNIPIDSSSSTLTINSISVTIEGSLIKTTFKQTSSSLIRLFIFPANNFSINKSEYKYEIEIKFKGEITNSMRGFYRSQASESNKEKYILSTQFEPNYAKFAFPTFDNPSIKSSFQLTFEHPSSLTVLSNMPVSSSTSKDSTSITKFEKTKKMSSYLLAWAIGSFNSVEGKTKRGLPIRVLTDRASTDQLEFPLQAAIKGVEYLESVLGVEYKFPKLDLLSIPNFEAGAMENWGLVTFREIAILTPKNSSVLIKAYVASVIIHELAHQWFGNLVTLKDWSDLWLNEGFASIFQNIAGTSIYQSKRGIGKFENLNKQNLIINGLLYDGYKEVRALSMGDIEESEIGQVFDPVAYSKGGAVLYTLKTLLTDTKFYQFLEEYLRKHQFGNVGYRDLISGLDEEKREIMERYITNKGAPLITVTTKKLTESGKKWNIKIQQSRFNFLGMQNGGNSEERTVWHVPVLIKGFSKEGKQFEHYRVLKSKEESYTVKFNSPVDFILLNADCSVYALPNYETITEENLKTLMLEQNILEFRSLLNFVPVWLKSGLLKISELSTLSESAYKFTNSNPSEENYWLTPTGFETIHLIATAFDQKNNYLKRHSSSLVSGSNLLKEFREKEEKKFSWIKGNISSWLETENSKGDIEAEFVQLSLSLLIDSVLIETHNEETISTYLGMLPDLVNNFEENSSNNVYSGLIIKSVVQNGNGLEDYNKLFSVYKSEKSSPEMQLRILRSLGEFEDQELFEKSLQLALEGKEIKDQDRIYVFSGIVENEKFTEKALEFVLDRWKEIKQKFESGNMLGSFVGLFGNSGKEEVIERLVKEIGDDKSVSMMLEVVKEKVKINIRNKELNKNLLE